MHFPKFLPILTFFLYLLFSFNTTVAQYVSVGNGGYTTQFPGVDQAGRNSFPSGTPFTTGIAATKPVPTNDWWSAQIKNSHADNLFNYPYTLKTTPKGLVVSYIPWGVIDNILPVIVGVTGLNSTDCKVSDFSDWTVQMEWANNNHQFRATSGIGMPFLYFEKKSTDVAQIEVNEGTVTVLNEMLIIENARNGADFSVYAPTGSVWTKSGNVYSSTLNGKNYWSMAFIPLNSGNITTTATQYKKYAYVFPTNTEVTWNYNESTSKLKTTFTTSVSVKEGTDTLMLQGLLPHQWSKLAAGSAVPNQSSYSSIRGELKSLAGNEFSTEYDFYGILPTLPYLNQYSNGFKPGELSKKIQVLSNDKLNPWTDSYNEGQMMNRLIQTARIADLSGDTKAVKSIVKTIKERLEDWLKAEAGEVAFLFYRNNTWSTLIGYPAGHGQDNNINDHHFHWGYFIHAASFMEQYEPGWAAKWGKMVNLLILDAANHKRFDPNYPFLRNFSPFAGHCWANGFASFPQGNDQESTSESMQFNSSLIHWGSITGNDTIRDLGIYLYATEQYAVEEYWFDMRKRVFKANHPYSLVSRVWGNSYDNGTFWTSDIAASYGIEMYPIHGGSLYLGQDTVYADKLWKEMEQNTGILSNQKNPNLWHDVYWKYLSLTNPAKAIQLYDSYPNRELKFGISDAQTYHWLHAMNSLGRVAKIGSDHEMSAVFINGNEKTYVAHNYSSSTLTVNFTDGYRLTVPPFTTKTSRDIVIKSVLTSDFAFAYPGGNAQLRLNVNTGNPTKVEFYQADQLIGTDTQAPFELKVNNLSTKKHQFYAKVYDGNLFNLSNIVEVLVGETKPYSGNPIAIPGIVDPTEYDFYEGGNGQNITYFDASLNNEGNIRQNEYVDALKDPSEGNTIGWISPGEFTSYSVNVAQPGLYTADIRLASGNTSGGGPLYFVLDEDTVSSAVKINYTGDWDEWKTITVPNIRLKGGISQLKILFEEGEFNLGKVEFKRTANLPYSQPVANAGSNKLVQLPATSSTLDGSGSSDPAGGSLNYKWAQLYGPSPLNFGTSNNATTSVSNLEEGVYKIKLTVDNGSYYDTDEMYLISSTQSNVVPRVELLKPTDNSTFKDNENVLLSALATDIDGSIAKVDFIANGKTIGSANQFPFEYSWVNPAAGSYTISAKATDNKGVIALSNTKSIVVDKGPSKELVYGTWQLTKMAKALKVGPERGSNGWWSNTTADVQIRSCLFNDSITFLRDGAFLHRMDASTWLEPWQGTAEGCGAPKAPHIGGRFSYSFNGTELTLRGLGAHIGLPKVHNNGEDGKPVQNTIIYDVIISNDTMYVDCSFPNGGGVNGKGWWRFTYSKISDLPEIEEPIDTTFVSEQLNEFKVLPYPNPFNHKLKINLKDKHATIQLYSLSGSLLIEQEVRNGFTALNTADLAEGMYILKVTGMFETQTFNVQKSNF